MTSQTMTILRTPHTDPRDVLRQIYYDLVQAERNTPISEEAKALFNKKHDIGRSWGNTDYTYDENIEVEVNDDSISITLSHADYCRSCYMGMVSDSMTIPDNLIMLFEAQRDHDDPDFEQAYNVGVLAWAKMVAVEWEERVKDEQRKADADAARKAAEREAQERVEFERLREKYA